MTERSGSESIGKAISLLKLIAESGPNGTRMADLVGASGLPRPTVARMVAALEQHRMAVRLKSSKRYVLGDYCSELFVSRTAPHDLRHLAAPVLQQVAKESGNCCILAVPVGSDSMCIGLELGEYPIQVLATKVGRRQPMGVGSGGTAMLADLLPEHSMRLIKSNARRYPSYGNLTDSLVRAMVKVTRERGYSLVRNYAVPGVSGIGMSIRNATGQVIGSISCATLETRMMGPVIESTYRTIRAAIMASQHNFDEVSPYLAEPLIHS